MYLFVVAPKTVSLVCLTDTKSDHMTFQGMSQPFGMGMGVHPGMVMQTPGMYGAQRMPLMGGYQQPRPPQQSGQSGNISDPFGAL